MGPLSGSVGFSRMSLSIGVACIRDCILGFHPAGGKSLPEVHRVYIQCTMVKMTKLPFPSSHPQCKL